MHCRMGTATPLETRTSAGRERASGRTTTLAALVPKSFGHFFALSLGAEVSSQTLLCKLEGALVLPDAQQFDDSLFVRGKPANFAHNRPDECLASRFARGCRALVGRRALGDDVAFVEADGDTSHDGSAGSCGYRQIRGEVQGGCREGAEGGGRRRMETEGLERCKGAVDSSRRLQAH